MPASPRLLLVLPLLLLAPPVRGEGGLAVTPSVGAAWISNLRAYETVAVGRLDATWSPVPEIGVGLFGAFYGAFRAGAGDAAAKVDLRGLGPSLTAAWRIHPELQPYLRAEYLLWSVHASGYGRTLAKTTGGSLGLAAGLRYAASPRLGVRLEALAYQRLSGADIRQVALGAALAF